MCESKQRHISSKVIDEVSGVKYIEKNKLFFKTIFDLLFFKPKENSKKIFNLNNWSFLEPQKVNWSSRTCTMGWLDNNYISLYLNCNMILYPTNIWLFNSFDIACKYIQYYSHLLIIIFIIILSLNIIWSLYEIKANYSIN